MAHRMVQPAAHYVAKRTNARGGNVSEVNTPSPPAGWYPDPYGKPVLRWWDGSRWSTQTQEAPPPVSKPPVAPTAGTETPPSSQYPPGSRSEVQAGGSGLNPSSRSSNAQSWWQKQPKAIRSLIGTGVFFIAAALYLPHASWFLNWHNNLSGGVFNISQAHALCNNPLVQAATVPGSHQATVCATANNWWTFFLVLIIVGVILLAIAAYRIFRPRQEI